MRAPTISAALTALLLTSVFQSADAATVQLIAHRGHLQPSEVENSLRQMERTGHHGIGVEMDLRRSKDGTLWILHDDTLDRATTGHGPLAEQTDATLAKVHLRSPEGRVSDELLPRFSQIVAWAEQTPGVELMLDLKGATAADVVPILRQHHLEQRSILLTFNPAQSAEAIRNGGEALVSVLVTQPTDIARYQKLAAGRPLAMYVPQHSAPSLFAAAHAGGATVISDAIEGPGGTSLDARAADHGCAVYRDFVSARKIDVLVSNTPGCAQQGLAGH